MADRIHITTAIFYCNGIPPAGSAYEALAADVFARYQRRKLGRDNVTFLSGTDEHGDKIRRAALAEGLAPKAYTSALVLGGRGAPASASNARNNGGRGADHLSRP